MNIHQFTSEQQKELIEDLMALKNAIPVEETCSPEEEDFA